MCRERHDRHLGRQIGTAIALLLMGQITISYIPLDVSATEPKTYTWAAVVDGFASSANNWNPTGVPVAGDNVIFDGTSARNCTWDIAGTFGDMRIRAEYSGTVLRSSSAGHVAFSDITISGGTLNGNGKMIVVNGNFVKNGGVFSNGVLDMAGDKKVLQIDTPSAMGLENLTISGNITIRVYNSTGGINAYHWYIAEGATLTLYPTAIRTMSYRVLLGLYEGAWVNHGTVRGTNASTSILTFDVRNNVQTILTPGNIDCSILLKMRREETSNATVTLGGPISTHGEVELINENSFGCTLTLNTNGYDISASGLYLDAGTILNVQDSELAIAGPYVPDKGTINFRNATLNLSPRVADELANDSILFWLTDPRAIHYRGVTYFTYQDRVGTIYVGAYNHTTHTVRSRCLFPQATYDDHSSPSLWIRPDGRILVAWANHAEAHLWVVISTNPEDISSWGAIRDIVAPGEKSTYVTLEYLPAERKLYLFSRNGSSQYGVFVFRTSTDYGVTWSPPTAFIDYRPGSPYVKTATNGNDRIYFVVTKSGDPDHSWYNVTTFYYRAGGFYRMDGTLIGSLAKAPFHEIDFTFVYNSRITGHMCWDYDIAYEGGQVAVVFSRITGPDAHMYVYARWNGTDWSLHELVHNGNMSLGLSWSFSGGIAIDHDDIDRVVLSVNRAGTYRGWLEIELWTTADGGSTWASFPITSNSGTTNFRPFFVRNHTNDLQLIWNAGAYDMWQNGLNSARLKCWPSLLRHESLEFQLEEAPISITTVGTLRLKNGSVSLTSHSDTTVYTVSGATITESRIAWSACASRHEAITWTVVGGHKNLVYQVYVDGEYCAEGFGQSFSFSYSGPAGEHTLEVITWQSIIPEFPLSVSTIGIFVLVSILGRFVRQKRPGDEKQRSR